MTNRSRYTLALAVALVATTGAAIEPRAPAGACIEADLVTTRRAVGDGELEFSLVGGRIVRSRLAAACPHLAEIDRFYILEFDARNGRRLCAGDRFRVVDQQVQRSGGSASSPWCRFGAFETVSAPPRRGDQARPSALIR